MRGREGITPSCSQVSLLLGGSEAFIPLNIVENVPLFDFMAFLSHIVA